MEEEGLYCGLENWRRRECAVGKRIGERGIVLWAGELEKEEVCCRLENWKRRECAVGWRTR